MRPYETTVVAKNQVEEIERVMECFQLFAAHHGIADAITRRVNTIVDEVLNNVISHAYEDDIDHEITARFEKAGERLIATFVDDGKPFNPLDCDAPSKPSSIEDQAPGGLGIHLVRKLSDEVTYNRHEDRNLLTTFLRLDRQGSSP